MKRLTKEHSMYLLVLTVIEILFSIIAIIAFVYQDKVDGSILNDVSLLLENLYTQTWWGLTLFTLAFISILSLTSIVYKKQEYHFISICLWGLLLIISINVNNSFKDIIMTSILFIPIIIINVITYKQEGLKIKKTNSRKKN